MSELEKKPKKHSKEEEDKIKLDSSFTSLFLTLGFIFFFLIYIISPFRNFISWFIYNLLSFLEAKPNTMNIILFSISSYPATFFFGKKKIRIIFSLIFAFVIVFILKRFKILLFDYYFYKFIFMILKKIYYVIHLVLSLIISVLLSLLISGLYGMNGEKKINTKVFTAEEVDYLNDYLNLNEPFFVLYSEKQDNNNQFYFEMLGKISEKKNSKTRKYRFVLLHYEEEIEKNIYFKLFGNKNVSFPQFAFIKGEKIEILQKFPIKEKLLEEIENFIQTIEIKFYEEKNVSAEDEKIKKEKHD